MTSPRRKSEAVGQEPHSFTGFGPKARAAGCVFILCVNVWRYFHRMGTPSLTIWEHDQSKLLFVLSCHSHVMRQPTKEQQKMQKVMLIGNLGRDGFYLLFSKCAWNFRVAIENGT